MRTSVLSPRTRQERRLRAVTSRAQEGGDAICAYEAHPQTRSLSIARLKWCEGRGPAHGNGAELKATCQTHLAPTANHRRRLPLENIGQALRWAERDGRLCP